jgi:LuxR family quorum-sensing system transcriptional regulator CciR
MRLSDFIDQSNQLDATDPLVALMERAAGELGFDRFAYCALTRHERFSDGSHPPPAVAFNFPASWTDYYFERNYQTRDPVLLYTPGLEQPFLWDWLNIAFELDEDQQTLMHEAHDAGLRDGVGIPLHGARGNVCVVTLAARYGHPDAAGHLRKLYALATQFHAAYSAVCYPDIYSRSAADVLSHRERECLQWMSEGKSKWEIGVILRVSENTVKYHVKSALKKLDAHNRVAAIVKAIRLGLISL